MNIKIKQIAVYIIGAALVTGGVILAGSLTPFTTPDQTNFVTLEDIYQKLVNNSYSVSGHNVSASNDAVSSMHTLQDIWDIIPTISSDQIVSGNTIMGVQGTYTCSGGNGSTTIDIPINGLLAYWKFDAGVGSTAIDSTGNGNTGTITGATWTVGKVGGALNFDGGENYVELPDTNLSTDNLTINLWFRTSSYDNGPMPFYYGDNTNGNALYVHLTSNNTPNPVDRGIAIGNWANYNDITAAGVWTAGEWNMLTITRTAGGVDGYINGNHVINQSSPMTISKLIFLISGMAAGSSAHRFNGDIDEIAFYNRVLSPQEIQDIYSVQNGTSTQGELIGNWRFDEGSGFIAADSSGNGNNLNLTGATWATGKVNSALDFKTGGVSVPGFTTLSGHDITISAWVNWQKGDTTQWAGDAFAAVGSTNNNQHLYLRSLRYDGGDSIWNFVGDNGNKIWVGADNNYNDIWWSSNAAINTNEWHHVSVVYSNSNNTIKIYIDGVLDRSVTLDASLNLTNDFYVGTDGWGSSFYGLIDELSLYNKALSAQEITDMYNNQNSEQQFSVTATGGGTCSTLNTSGYNTCIFTSNGTLQVTGSGNVEALVVAGGGGGGWNIAGGGGGGGVIYNPARSVTSGEYLVTVGNGGLGATDPSNTGANGGDSSFDYMIAVGGGGGTSAANNTARNGGSGGGSAFSTGNGTGIEGQGHDGGVAPDGTELAAGGGGGASAVGENGWYSGNDCHGGNGGEGYTSSISGTSHVYGSGGGGASAYSPCVSDLNYGLGGTGGGNGGAVDAAGNLSRDSSDATYYGCGGGGGEWEPVSNGGSNGYQGIVIIRYQI